MVHVVSSSLASYRQIKGRFIIWFWLDIYLFFIFSHDFLKIQFLGRASWMLVNIIESVSNGHVIDTPLSSFSKIRWFPLVPTSVSCELTKIEGIEEVRESRNDSYYTKHKHPNHVQPTNQRITPYIHTRESYIMKSTP
jgi:hypothetical protein